MADSENYKKALAALRSHDVPGDFYQHYIRQNPSSQLLLAALRSDETLDLPPEASDADLERAYCRRLVEEVQKTYQRVMAFTNHHACGI
jgi:hypothetical protein